MSKRKRPCRKVRVRGIGGLLGIASPSKTVECMFSCKERCEWWNGVTNKAIMPEQEAMERIKALAKAYENQMTEQFESHRRNCRHLEMTQNGNAYEYTCRITNSPCCRQYCPSFTIPASPVHAPSTEPVRFGCSEPDKRDNICNANCQGCERFYFERDMGASIPRCKAGGRSKETCGMFKPNALYAMSEALEERDDRPRF